MKFLVFNFQFSNKKTTYLFLFGIIILAALLRLWQLGNVPPSPDWDEAALGYNAFSILHTGRDEYGKFLPVVLRSFDDYKQALYAYLIIPFVQLFGLTIQAVRLPSVIFGIGGVLGAFFLVKELFKKNSLALLSCFLLAISPWYLQFSRIAFESQVGLSCNILGVLFFLRGLKKPWMVLVSAVFFAMSIYVYQSEKVFVPLIVLSLVLIYRKEIFSLPKKLLCFIVIFVFLLLLPMGIYTLTNKAAFARAQGVSIFSDQTISSRSSQQLLQDEQKHDVIGIFFDNRRVIFAKTIIGKYRSHYNLNWLFITGDLNRHHAPNMGLLYLWELPFLFVGAYGLIFGNYSKKTKFILFSWFLLAPIPASVTTGVPHAVRDLNAVVIYEILSAIGVLTVFQAVTKSMRNIAFIVMILFFFLNFMYFLDQYFVQQNYFVFESLQYGYAKIVPEVARLAPKFKKIVVSNHPYMDQSYIFFLFYLRYNPTLYQSQTKDASGGFRENHTFGMYEFRPITWEKEIKNSDTLFVGRSSDFPANVDILTQVNFLDNKQDMEIVK